MTFIQTTPPAKARGEVRTMYERQQARFGYVPNYAKLFSHRPELMGHWANFLSGIRRHVDQRRFELVTLAAAHALRNSYCCLAHGQVLTKFFSTDEIQDMVSDAGLSALSAKETAMMGFARQVARDASKVTAGDVAVLKDHGFDDSEIFDIAATAAARAFFAKLCDSLGTEADVGFMEINDDLRRSLTVGRPIAVTASEQLEATR